MKNFKIIIMAVGFSLAFSACSTDPDEIEEVITEPETIEEPDEVDEIIKRNAETETFYANLKDFATEKIMFGMANPTTLGYKMGPKNNDLDQSDSKDITGSHPAFYESDFMWYRDEQFKEWDIEAMKQAHARGAVVGYTWHLRGRESGEFYVMNNGAFSQDQFLGNAILSGGTRETNPALDWYLTELDEVVIPVFEELGFPVLFRPFHEMNGGWFWWGSHSEAFTPEKYKQLYQLTVDYLREKEIDNVLYVWAPTSGYVFQYYPGDEYVDVLGLDMYEPGIAVDSGNQLVDNLGNLQEYALTHDKISGLTETGLRKSGDQFRYPNDYPEFWTKYVLDPIINNETTRGISFITSWYNADWNGNDKGQFYIPFKGIEEMHEKGAEAVEDFLNFYNAPETVFENEMPNLYD